MVKRQLNVKFNSNTQNRSDHAAMFLDTSSALSYRSRTPAKVQKKRSLSRMLTSTMRVVHLIKSLIYKILSNVSLFFHLFYYLQFQQN